MKKVMVCGCGAQGSTICRRLDEEPNIEEVVCADYNLAAAEAVCKLMKKGTPKQVNAAHVDEIAKAAEGCELIVNVMPLEFGVNVMQAALQIKACYQDLSACENVVEGFPEYDTWLEGIRYMYTEYGRRFAENGTTAIIGTGSATRAPAPSGSSPSSGLPRWLCATWRRTPTRLRTASRSVRSPSAVPSSGIGLSAAAR